MEAEIIAVGSELLTPHRLDTNSLWLTAKLNSLGILVVRKTIVGDSRVAVRTAFEEALARSALVVGIGGLGPTEDDVTREAVAELLGRRLEPNPEILARIEERFRARGKRMPEVNTRQALVPAGATVLDNENGTAPGLWLEEKAKIVLLLPGPPPELMPMFEQHCLGRLKERAPKSLILTRVFKVTGLAESEMEAKIAPLYTQYTNPTTTLLALPGEVQIHLKAVGGNRERLERQLDELADKIEAALGNHIFARGFETLEQVVGLYLMMRGSTLAVAESCTGGLVSRRLTDVPGSSRYFLGGVICYSDKLKVKLASVSETLLKRKGAVSEDVATALARGIRRRTGAGLGLGVTCITGPTGGMPHKPVGTTYLALAKAHREYVEKHRFLGDRERVRWQASQAALDLVRRKLMK
ncbi:MAG: competence/damage-inducible protein A [Terriglobia bacterium]